MVNFNQSAAHQTKKKNWLDIKKIMLYFDFCNSQLCSYNPFCYCRIIWLAVSYLQIGNQSSAPCIGHFLLGTTMVTLICEFDRWLQQKDGDSITAWVVVVCCPKATDGLNHPAMVRPVRRWISFLLPEWPSHTQWWAQDRWETCVFQLRHMIHIHINCFSLLGIVKQWT